MDAGMQRAFDEIAAQNSDLARLGGRPLRPGTPRRRRPKRGDGVPLLASALALALVVAVTGAWRHVPGVGPLLASGTAAVADAAGSGRVLPAVEVTMTGPHEFLATRAGGGPVGYDPCRAVHWTMNPAGMPAGGAEVVTQAVQLVSAATGLAFVHDGLVDDQVRFDGGLVPALPGMDRAPVLVAWTDETAVPELAGDTIGLGGSTGEAPTGPGSERYVTGAVALDVTQMTDLVTRDPAAARAVVMHELGHVVGLDHVDDPGELMNGTNLSRTSWGPGDLAGLAAVGAAPCGV